jgi:DNA-binding transcriptional ArsR family regulator
MPAKAARRRKPRGISEVECADRVFAALAHPARRQILLSVHYRGASRAGEIANRFECSWPTTSRHLATLVASGLLEVESAGRERIYRANDELVRDVLQTWSQYFESGATT